MNVFLTGATGVLGRSVISPLIQSGHRLRALARSTERVEVLRELGTEPIVGDLFDPVSLARAIAGCQAVLHLATRIPTANRMGRPDAWAENDRIRGEGTRNLVDAALANGATTFLYPSVCRVYADRAADWIEAPVAQVQSASLVESTLAAETEVERFTAAGHRGIVLRMGAFYGPQSSHTLQEMALARKGIVASFGRRDAYHSFLWIDDAGKAVIASLSSAPSGIFDVVDDEPLTNQDLWQIVAAASGKTRLWPLPGLALRWSVGNEMLALLSRSQRVCNRRFKAATEWAPTIPTARLGWRLIAKALAKRS